MYCLVKEIPGVWERYPTKDRASTGQSKSQRNFSRDDNSFLQSSWLLPPRNFHDLDEKRGRNCPTSGLWRHSSQWGWDLSDVGISWAGCSEQRTLLLSCRALWPPHGSSGPPGIRNYPSGDESCCWVHCPRHCPDWSWHPCLEKKTPRAKWSHLPSYTTSMTGDSSFPVVSPLGTVLFSVPYGFKSRAQISWPYPQQTWIL